MGMLTYEARGSSAYGFGIDSSFQVYRMYAIMV